MDAAAAIAVPPRLDAGSVRGMNQALNAAIAGSAAVIVLEGEPGRFCQGLDLAEPVSARAHLPQLAELLQNLLLCPRPTLAVLDGPALGGGLGLASACDLVLASERASLGLPEALYGLAPAIIRPALRTRLSPQKLRLLLLTCHSRSAAEGLALGLVDQLVPVERLDSARRQAVRQLRRASGRTVAAARKWEREELQRQLADGVEETGRALAEPGVLQALQSFMAEEAVPWMP